MKSNIKVEIETIQPDMAKQWLAELNPRNRNPSANYNNRLAADIKRGHFVINGETIIFDDTGSILDGQGRLAACVAANCPIETIVVRGVPRYYKNGSNTHTQDTIDRGRARTVAHQLQMGHGYKNANCVAATVRAVAQYLTGRDTLSLSTIQTVEILRLVGKHIQSIIDLMPYAGQRKSYLVAMLALYRMIDRASADEFTHKYISLENLTANDPVLVLNKWIQNNPGYHTSHGRRIYNMKVVTCALRKFVNKDAAYRLSASDDDYAWFVAQHKRLQRKVGQIVFG